MNFHFQKSKRKRTPSPTNIKKKVKGKARPARAGREDPTKDFPDPVSETTVERVDSPAGGPGPVKGASFTDLDSESPIWMFFCVSAVLFTSAGHL